MRTLALACRRLLKTPFVTAVAVLSLGLGIGANTAVFSLFDQILLKPLPVAAPADLVNLSTTETPRNGSTSCGNAGDCNAVFDYATYVDLARDQQVFTGIAAHHLFSASVGYHDETLPVDGMEVSGNYFSVLGLWPAVGRLLTPADTATIGETPAVVLSYDYWVTRFGRDPGVTHESVVVNGQTLGIVGVAPEGFDGTTRGTRAKVFVPITLRALLEPPFSDFSRRDDYWVYLFARLEPGVAMRAAEDGVNVPYHAILAAEELPAQHGLSGADRDKFVARRITLTDGRRGQSYIFGASATPLIVLQLVTAIVLLIACANIANLLLARAAGRAGEMAVRLSLGASRGQLIRQLLVESCMLGLMGGVVGLLILQWTIDLTVPRLALGALDPAVGHVRPALLAFTGAVALGTGVLFGLFPALHATRPDLATTLKGQAGQPSGARTAARFRTALVVTEIALSMGLLTSATLFTKSLLNISRVDLGVKVDHVLTFALDAQRNGYAPPRAQQLFGDILARLAAQPGVTSASAARVPLIANSSSSTTDIGVEGVTLPAGQSVHTSLNEVAPRYFATVGTPILSGRDFTDGDVTGAPNVAIVNEAFARQFGLGANPVGRRVKQHTAAYDTEIIGLVRDAKYRSVRDPVPPVLFTPYRQDPRLARLVFYVNTGGDPAALLDGIRPLVASFDPQLPVQRLQTMPDQIAQNLSDDRLLSTMSATFAAIATALAAIGLYGVIAYTVSQRTREFGLRMALGAAPGRVQRLVLTQVMWMTIIGGAIGLGLAIAAGGLARKQLYEISSADPAVLVTSAAILAAVALAAGYVPSRRASRVDPMKALRWE